jgi:copper transport protein
MIASEATASAINYIALALLFGQLVTAGFILPLSEAAPLRRSLLNGAQASLLVFLCVSLLALLLQGVKLQRGFPSGALLWRYLNMTQSGRVWLAREVYAVMLALFLWALTCKDAPVKLIRVALVFALPLVASRSLTSHAVAVREDTLLAVSSDALHLTATALWAGGLIALWRVFRFATKQQRLPTWTVSVVKRFSCLARASVSILVLTGFYQSWVHLGSFANLLNTDSGKVLSLKLFLFILMAAMGAVNFLSTQHLLTRASGRSEKVRAAHAIAKQRIAVESGLGILIFCASGLLTTLPPGVHAFHQTPLAPAPSKTDSTANKTYAPAQGAAVRILSPRTGEIFTGDRVPLKFTLLNGKRGHHVHAYVDDELMGMFQSNTGTLNGLKPGRHILELRVVAEDHQTELAASDRVEFDVK